MTYVLGRLAPNRSIRMPQLTRVPSRRLVRRDASTIARGRRGLVVLPTWPGGSYLSRRVQEQQFGQDGLGFSLKPPKWIRRAKLKDVVKVALIALPFIPGVGPAAAAIARGLPGATTALRIGRAIKALPGVTTATRIGTAVSRTPGGRLIGATGRGILKAAGSRFLRPGGGTPTTAPPDAVMVPGPLGPMPVLTTAPPDAVMVPGPLGPMPVLTTAPTGSGADAASVTASAPRAELPPIINVPTPFGPMPVPSGSASAAPRPQMPGWVVPAVLIGGGALLLSQRRRRHAA